MTTPSTSAQWKLVPVEPTEAMMNAAPASYSAAFQAIWPKICGDIWRAMLTASPSPAASPASPSGVEALEWQPTPSGYVWLAPSAVGRYFVEERHSDFRWSLESQPGRWTANTLDEAKTAAQADYEARILSALASDATPAPTSGSEDGKPGAGMSEMAEIARVVSEWRHGPMLSAEALRQIAALSSSAAPAVEPVAWRWRFKDDPKGIWTLSDKPPTWPNLDIHPLYAHPAPATVEMPNVEVIARTIWNIRREEEDRCDMELEDMGSDHSVWVEARAIAALAPATEGRKS